MTRHQILLIEDSPEIQLIVKSVLDASYPVKVVSTAAQALSELEANRYSLILLDVGLPDEDGFQFCAKLQGDEKYKKIPVIFITGKRGVGDMALGFSLGAEDYIAKPFDPLELQVRVQAKMKKIVEQQQETSTLQRGSFRVSIPQQKIFITENGAQKDLSLTPIEFKLLYFFISHDGHVLGRQKLLTSVWGEDVHVTERTVDTSVYTLRKKMGDLGKLIRSVPKVGYCFSQFEKPAQKAS